MPLPFSLSVLPCFPAASQAPWPFPVLLGGVGQGSCCPMPWALSLGTVDTKCLAQSPFPAWFPQGQIRSALAWNSLQAVGQGETSLPTSSVGTDTDPPPLPRRVGRRGEDLLPLVKATGLCPSGPQSPASLGSLAAEGCSPLSIKGLGSPS